jgi:hypothetical protein
MKLIIEIELGNDAMQNPQHVADALRETADKIDQIYKPKFSRDDTGKIYDLNGNHVGTWRVK